MPSIILKLGKLLKEEYLTLELEGAQASLRKVDQVPWNQLDEHVKLWAHEVRESSYDMEDSLDTFLVHIQGREATKKEGLLKCLIGKMPNLVKKSKKRRKISIGVKDIMTHVNEVKERCLRYKVDDIVARPATTSMVDPRLAAMFSKVKNLVGISKSSGELISMLQPLQRGDATNAKMKIVSVVGVVGLGKTTLAKAVYDKLKDDFDCKAFVPVGRNPDLKKVFKDILIDLDSDRDLQLSMAILDERKLINKIRKFFIDNKKRYA